MFWALNDSDENDERPEPKYRKILSLFSEKVIELVDHLPTVDAKAEDHWTVEYEMQNWIDMMLFKPVPDSDSNDWNHEYFVGKKIPLHLINQLNYLSSFFNLSIQLHLNSLETNELPNCAEHSVVEEKSMENYQVAIPIWFFLSNQNIYDDEEGEKERSSDIIKDQVHRLPPNEALSAPVHS